MKLKEIITAGILGLSTLTFPINNLYYNDNKKINVEDLAIMVIDMQKEFLDKINNNELKKEIKNQEEVIDFAAKNNIPVYVITYENHGKTISELEDNLKNVKHVLRFNKKEDSAFSNDYLYQSLSYGMRTNLLLMGVNASACVYSTAVAAKYRIFNILTSSDLIADPDFSKNQDSMSAYLYEEHQKMYGKESRLFYQKQGIFKDYYKDLLKLINVQKTKFKK